MPPHSGGVSACQFLIYNNNNTNMCTFCFLNLLAILAHYFSSKAFEGIIVFHFASLHASFPNITNNFTTLSKRKESLHLEQKNIPDPSDSHNNTKQCFDKSLLLLEKQSFYFEVSELIGKFR